MHNQHAGLSQQLAAQHITERQNQAAQARLAQSAGRPASAPHQLIDQRYLPRTGGACGSTRDG